MGIPRTLIGEAVFARCLSAQKDERVAASKILEGPAVKFEGDRKAFLEDLRQALLAAKMVSYAQGYELMREAARELDRKSTRLNSSHVAISYAVFCLKKKNIN